MCWHKYVSQRPANAFLAFRYEVNESRMGDDCAQYLAQLQKDWERERVKLGVEALRKEVQEMKSIFISSLISICHSDPRT